MKKLIIIIGTLLFNSACSHGGQQLNPPQTSKEPKPLQILNYLMKPDGQYSVGYHDFFFCKWDIK